jgi:signal transduction histidine kinase
MSRLRPRPLVVDSLLALALAVVALGLMEAGRSAETVGPVPGWSVNPPPRDVRAGDVWNARISVSAPRKAPPLLTVQNTATGTLMSTEAAPTGAPGLYRARVLFPEAGDYTYSVVLGDVAGEASGSPAGLVLLTLLATLPIALRRRFPLPVLAVTLAAALAAAIAYGSFAWLGSLVALYSVAAHDRRPRSLYAAAATAAALPLLFLGDPGLGPWELVAIFAVFAAAWLLGDGMRARRERRQANVQRAAAEEQTRMGRELHDIIGHSVSVMTIQAAAAGDVFDSRPAEAREALRAIESTGRETLAELRRLLAGVNGSFAPAPGLENLEELAGRVRSAGLAVELSGDRPELSPSLDLTAYRIVQEALTNTLKHARATTARVTVREVDGVLEIEVVDNGRGAPTVIPGHGIIGMRERAASFGGEVTARGEPGGFAVRARIPVG